MKGSRTATDASGTADAVAAAVLAVPGVTSLHGGAFGEVGTYLPGRRVTGVRTQANQIEVHVVVAGDIHVLHVAEQIRAVVAPLAMRPVNVFIEDIDPASSSAELHAPSPASPLPSSGLADELPSKGQRQ